MHQWLNGSSATWSRTRAARGEKISVKQKEPQIKRVQASMEKWKDLSVPEWLALDREKLTGEVVRLPTKADAGLPVEEALIVELYSK